MLYGRGAVYGMFQTDAKKAAWAGAVYQANPPGCWCRWTRQYGRWSAVFVSLADIQCGGLHQVLQQGILDAPSLSNSSSWLARRRPVWLRRCRDLGHNFRVVGFQPIGHQQTAETYFPQSPGGCSPAGEPHCWRGCYPDWAASIGQRVPASNGGNRSPIPGRRTPCVPTRTPGPCRPILGSCSKGSKGMVFTDAAWAHKALNVPVPTVMPVSIASRLRWVHPSFVHFGVTQMSIGNVVFYTCHFSFFSKHIEPEAVAGGEESSHFLHQGMWFRFLASIFWGGWSRFFLNIFFKWAESFSVFFSWDCRMCPRIVHTPRQVIRFTVFSEKNLWVGISLLRLRPTRCSGNCPWSIPVGARSPVQCQNYLALADIQRQTHAGYSPAKRHQPVESGYEITTRCSVKGTGLDRNLLPKKTVLRVANTFMSYFLSLANYKYTT